MAQNKKIDLGGNWLFRQDPERMGEHYRGQLDIPWQYDARWMNWAQDERQWTSIRVPSCWQESGHAYNGAAWYRTTFPTPIELEKDARVWLQFNGIDYFADIWLNERYLGSHEGYFSAFEFEATPYLASDNLLVARVDAPNDINAKEAQPGQLKGMLKGALQRWDVNNPQVNPGGIWNDVTIRLTGPGAIRNLQLTPLMLDLPESDSPAETAPATLYINLTLAGFQQNQISRNAKLNVRLRKLDEPTIIAETSQSIPALPTEQTWPLQIELDEAELWYTWDLGEPNLYTVEVALEIDGKPSDEVEKTFGFRQIDRTSGWETYLNGIRFFQRGANYLSDQYLSSMTIDRYRQDVELLREANLNTVHPFAVVEKQEFYEQCDRQGILVYQDFPMWLTMSNQSDLVRRANIQLEELIDQFGHHPSIGIWNFGSQPSVANFEKLGASLVQTARRLDPSRIAHQANSMIDRHGREMHPLDDYKWHRKRLDEFQAKYDWRVDTHQYFGWYWGDLPLLKNVSLDDLQLITEYGAQALPDEGMLRKFIPEDALFPPAWPYYAQRCFQPDMQYDYIPPSENLDQMITDSQAYQARFIQYHTEYYRRHKFAPTNGAHYFCFNDCWPAITWSVVDYERQRKPGFHALRQSMAPLQILLDYPDECFAGQDNAPTVWVVNDFPNAYQNLVVKWKALAQNEKAIVAQGELVIDAKANSLARIGQLDYSFEQAGKFTVKTEIWFDDSVLAENSYQLKVD